MQVRSSAGRLRREACGESAFAAVWVCCVGSCGMSEGVYSSAIVRLPTECCTPFVGPLLGQLSRSRSAIATLWFGWVGEAPDSVGEGGEVIMLEK